MRYEPTKKAGVAPAREIAKVTRQTLLGGVAVWCNVWMKAANACEFLHFAVN